VFVCFEDDEGLVLLPVVVELVGVAVGFGEVGDEDVQWVPPRGLCWWQTAWSWVSVMWWTSVAGWPHQQLGLALRIRLRCSVQAQLLVLCQRPQWWVLGTTPWVGQ
jgi:hypothetical protein